MKKIYFLLILSITVFAHSQFKKNEGIAIRYSKSITASYSIYEKPLRINQVNSQKKIDYSNYQGIIQSFFSASNKKWALSEYLDGRTDIVRNQEHFEAVKKNDTTKNYIQIETVYHYNYDNRKMALIKYSFIIKDIPFPIIGVISVEKFNNRWYISDLLNQRDMIMIFSNIEPSILLELLQGKSDNNFIKKLIDETRGKNLELDFQKLAHIFREWSLNKERNKLNKIVDKRLVIKNHSSPKANIKQDPVDYHITTKQYFILKNAFFYEYDLADRILNEKTINKYKNKPEFNLIAKEKQTLLLFKFSFEDNNNNYIIIKYRRENEDKLILLKKENNKFSEIKNKYLNWMELFKIIKTQLFYDLYSNDKLPKVKKYIFTENKVLDIDRLAYYVKKNKNSLAKYLD